MANAKTSKLKGRFTKQAGATQVPGMIGVAFVLGLLALLPWLGNQTDVSTSFRVLQISVALVLALSGGVCLGVQIATNSKHAAPHKKK